MQAEVREEPVDRINDKRIENEIKFIKQSGLNFTYNDVERVFKFTNMSPVRHEIWIQIPDSFPFVPPTIQFVIPKEPHLYDLRYLSFEEIYGSTYIPSITILDMVNRC